MFPDTVAFPTLPIVADGTLVYPSTSECVAGTWACAAELSFALRLGAEVFCQVGYEGRVRLNPDSEPSRVLRHGVKQLIDDRNTAKRVFGKGSIEERTLKTAGSSVYGKTAQDVAEQNSWDARLQYHMSRLTPLVNPGCCTENEVRPLVLWRLNRIFIAPTATTPDLVRDVAACTCRAETRAPEQRVCRPACDPELVRGSDYGSVRAPRVSFRAAEEVSS